MNRNDYFVCKRCGINTMKSRLHKNEMCDSCNQKYEAEKFTNELTKFPFNTVDKSFLYVMNVNIHDYEKSIISKDYILIKVNEDVKGILSKILELVRVDIRQEILENSKYLFITDILLDFERIECHLHNRFNKESCKFSRSVIFGLKIRYTDWAFRFKSSENILNITIDGIDEMSKLRLDSTKPLTLDEIDVQHIVSKLSESKKDYLFRGINRHYFLNDGIAASIYRNNADLVKYSKLQVHEREVVNNLLSKDYYQSESGKSSISALTDLRHNGKDTCLLDFSEDFKIALFFSCQPTIDNSATIGEILVLSRGEYELKEDVTYPNEKDFLIVPAITEVTRNRVRAQKSVFLYCHQGYLPRDKSENKVKNLLIASSLKSPLYKYCGYSEEKIYPDFYGFIENPENFITTAKLYCQDKENEEKDEKKYV